MLFAASIVIYAVMFLNVDELDHIYISLTRLYMTILMICSMAVVMIVLMPKMYANKQMNSTIYISSALTWRSHLPF